MMNITLKPFWPVPRLFMIGIATVIPIITSAFPAHAKDMFLRFEAYWGGAHIADFTLSLTRKNDTFENTFHLESRGLTRYFTHLSAIATSTGHIIAPPAKAQGMDTVGNGANLPQAETYMAQNYRTEYTNKRHFRWVDIKFGAPGKPATAITGTAPVPGREENWNPKDKGPEALDKVPAQYRIGVNDPISLVPQMIAIVRTHLHGGPDFGIIKGFDGRRRFDMNIRHMGNVQRTIAGKIHATYWVRINPKPVAGFKNKQKTLWNNAAYDFYLSRDDEFVPLQIVPVKHGPVLTMVKRCDKACEIKSLEE